MGERRRIVAAAWKNAGWWLTAATLAAIAYARFFRGTYFSQDDYVWLCFSRFYDFPPALLWRDTLCGQFFRPVGQWWWMGVHSLAGDRVEAYQAAFLLLHAANGALAGILARRLFGAGFGFFVFVLFLLNPLFAARISTHYHFNFDLLGMLFFLTALVLLTMAVQRGSAWLAGVSVLAAVAAYFAKEAFYTLPAAAALVLGVESAGARFRLATLRRRLRWLWPHVAAAIGAFAWRTFLIGNLGGYALASASGGASLADHAADRLLTFAGFAGWSLVPHLARWNAGILWPAVASLALLAVLTLLARGRAEGPGPLWIWCWMVVTWAPSMLMTTYAPVSFYACSFGSILLLARVVQRARLLPIAAVPIGLYLALAAFDFYGGRAAYAAKLRSQHEALKSASRELLAAQPAGAKVVLLRCHPELFPDPVVKYSRVPGERMPEVLFLSDKPPVNWVVTNRDGPGAIEPLVVSPTYQDGYMAMDPYRVYPLEFPTDRGRVLLAGSGFRFYVWKGGRLVDITAANPFQRTPARRTIP